MLSAITLLRLLLIVVIDHRLFHGDHLLTFIFLHIHRIKSRVLSLESGWRLVPNPKSPINLQLVQA